MNDRKISAMAESSLYPLTAVILSAGFVLYKYILQVYPGIISNDLVTEFELSALELGNLSAYLFYTYTIVQIFSGILIDRFNLRYITTGAIIVASTGMLIFAQADS